MDETKLERASIIGLLNQLINEYTKKIERLNKKKNKLNKNTKNGSVSTFKQL